VQDEPPSRDENTITVGGTKFQMRPNLLEFLKCTLVVVVYGVVVVVYVVVVTVVYVVVVVVVYVVVVVVVEGVGVVE
jgi:hypothetical protein